MGWYVRCSGQDSHVQSIIKHYYAQMERDRHLAFIYEDELEGEFSVSVWEQNGLRSLEGYYIYYERNPLMQEFLIRQKNGQVSSENIRPREEPVRRYRTENVQREQGETPKEEKMPENTEKKKPQKAVYAACAAVLIIAAATGIAQMGNYQGLKSFQKTIQTISGTLLNKNQDFENASDREKEDIDRDATGENPKETSEKTEQAEESPGQRAESEPEQKEQSEESRQDDSSGKTDKNAEESGADSGQKEEETVETASQQALEQGYYIVRKGDSLLSISRKLYQTDAMVDEICAANGIQNLDVIYEGQKLKLP